MATIETRIVTKFAKRAAAINRATKKQKELREEIIEAMKKGAELPTNGPYIIQLSQVGGKDINWKEELQEVFERSYAKKYSAKAAIAMAAKKIEKMYNEAMDKEGIYLGGDYYIGGVKLEGKVNPDYRVEKKQVA